MEHYRRSKAYREVLHRQGLDDVIKNLEPVRPLVNGGDEVDILPMSLGLSISHLWEDPGVQQIYGLSHQFQINETAK